MSPERPSPQRVSGTTSPSNKPYSRTQPAAISQDMVDIAQPEIAQQGSSKNKAGFPTYAQYKQIETAFITGLHPRRQAKALISQELFDRIWDVLLNKPGKSPETAQFRFWVRRKFCLGSLLETRGEAPGAGSSGGSHQTVLLHENSIVAVQEQIYDLLCYSHGATNHGGRDRTCAALRKHYTWVPKELVAKFIKICPTCVAKKSGFPKLSNSEASDVDMEPRPPPSLREYLRSLAGHDTADPGPSADDDHVLLRASSLDGSESANQAAVSNPLDRQANHSAPMERLKSPSGLRSLPMSREVSLYQGIPNGWQFQHADYTTARDAFTKRDDTAISSSSGTSAGRPRIPSVAPMVSGYPARDQPQGEALPLLRPCDWNQAMDMDSQEVLPAALQSAAVVPSCKSGQTHSPQIDPLLLALSTNLVNAPVASSQSPPTSAREISSKSRQNGDEPTESLSYSNLPVKARGTTASILRAAAPPSINLESLSSQTAIQNFLTLRDADRAILSPDTPQPLVSIDSPASSVGSYSSQISAFPMTAASSISPPNTALPTPGDEPMGSIDGLGKDLADTADAMKLSVSLEAVCDHETLATV